MGAAIFIGLAISVFGAYKHVSNMYDSYDPRVIRDYRIVG